MIVYQAHNPISNRFYIGKTTKPIWIRRKRHAVDAERGNTNSLFHKAIRKYGIDVFDWCVLAHASSVDELNRMESYWISLAESSGNSLYNLRPGGTGGSYAGEKNHNYGKSLSDGRRNKISLSLKKYYENRPGTMTGMSGDLAPFFGSTHTSESRQKISRAKKGRPRADIVGSNNPSARKVICITTGEVFDTASQAAKTYECDLSSIIKCCRGKAKTVKGRTFQYSESEMVKEIV